MNKICPKCNILHNLSWIFCSRSCANSRVHSIKTRAKISNSLVFKNYSLFFKKKVLFILNKKFNHCVICNKEILSKNKTCSKKCNNELLSKKRMISILNKWINNFNNEKKLFSYKWINIICDSKLEMAWIVYLNDIINLENINRFNWILNFKDENWNNKKFNPDFIWYKEWKIYIIEVKMLWSKNSEHIYNKYIFVKKNILNDFCKKKMIYNDMVRF
jgi:hypothetical protein